MASIITKIRQSGLEDDQVLSLKNTDALYKEISAERSRATAIMKRVMKRLGVEDAYAEMRKGDWRAPGELVNISNIDFSS